MEWSVTKKTGNQTERGSYAAAYADLAVRLIMKFPRYCTSNFVRKSPKYFDFGEIRWTDPTDFFLEDIPVLSRVK